nr:uncharacterized protein LOC113693422 [Coffea arabica]
MLQFQCLVVLLLLILIGFFFSGFEYYYDYIGLRDGHRYVYHTFNSKHTSCDHSPSTCVGNDINLKCPFQFRGDHPNLCPIEFSCENNRTVLPIIGGTHPEIQQYNFSVELNSIDYEQRTLRIFDPGVQKNNCSTLPVYPLGPHDYNYYYQPGTHYGMEIDPDAGSLVFVSCKNPVKSKYPLYVDTASCNITANHFSKMKAPSNYYSYVVVGETVVASDIKESCTVYKTAPVDLRCLPNVTAGDISFQDIHNLLSNGLELGWLRESRSWKGFPWLPQGRVSYAIGSYGEGGVAVLCKASDL